MKARSFRRMLSAFLAVVMVLMAMPLSGIVVNAATTITTVDDMGKLGSGFNMLGDKYLGDAPMRQIFVSTSGITAQFDSNPVSKSSYSYITSVSDYFSNEAQTIKVGFGMGSEASAKLTIKIVELNLSQKYKLDFSTTNGGTSSSNTSDSTEYMLLEYMHQIGTYTMWLDNETQIARLWQTDANGNFTILNADFVNSLLNDDPATFFKNYGSHLITQYTAGGTATSSYYGEIHYESSSESFEHNTSVSESAEGALSKHKELESIYSSNSGNSTGSTVKRGESTARGGTGNFAWDEASASSWATTVDKDHHIALVDDNLMMLPMWELLVDDSQADRRIELEQYFNENVDSQYAELYGKYIYSPTGNKDYTGYTFVQTAEDFNNIRNNLNGKYVLLNNIDLSCYDEWSPIGTKATPFTGTIDGNGNTVSGLSISKCDSYAGLLGYNAGTVENLTVSGNIDADGSGSVNDVAYIGGIAGYNAGTISNCRNMVAVNGKLTVTDEETTSATTTIDDFFTKYSTAIENAKQTAVQTLSNNSTISVGLTPVRLTGTATGVTINISGSSSNDPAFIVLENANITGTITHNSDRKVCIISIGDANTITGKSDNIAINTESSSLYITGNAKLTITGGKGSDGGAGNDGTGNGSGDNPPSRAGAGKDGGDGSDGRVAILTTSLNVKDTDVSLVGGNGGNGGKGGNGAAGGSGNYPGSGGHAGNGGDGGDAGLPIQFKDATTITLTGYANVSLLSGSGGAGGNGGNGGKGGDNTWGFIACNGTSGGDAGDGGDGGNSFYAFVLGDSGITVSEHSFIFSDAGTVGNKGTAGTYGKKGSTKVSVSNSPTNGSPGSDGSDGGFTTNSLTNGDGSARSAYRQYILYASDSCSWETAKQNAETAGGVLASIGSAQEQGLVQQLLSISGNTNGSFWIGLRIVSLDNNTAICEWADGSRIKIVGTGSDAVAYRLDDDNNIIGEAYVNFNVGEPNNSNNSEFFMHLTTDAKWNDNSESARFGYIMEFVLSSASKNTTEKNAVIVGGICGYNAGTVKSAYNTAKVSVNKAYSLQSGISAYTGGVSGYNNGSISYSTNTGDVTTLAISDSMSYYADAYAYNIGKGGTISNCSGYVTTRADAYSANTLETFEWDTSNTEQGSIKANIDTYWKNSELAINDVTRTEYLRNSAFNKDSLDLSYGDVTVNAYTVRNNFYQYGTATVTVIYSDGTDEYTRYIPVHIIEETPKSVDIYMLPKTEFIVGDTFTYEGLALKLIYNNGSEKLLSSKSFTVTEPNMGVTGTQTVNISYEYAVGEIFTCAYNINVSPVSVVGIQITKLPDKLTYSQGEQIDLTGMQVTKIYNNGKTEVVPHNQLRTTYNFMNIGETTVTINYSGFTANFACTVTQIETDATIIVESKSSSASGTVRVPVVVSNNPGIASVLLTITYDESVLTLIEIEDTKIISGGNHSATLTSPYQLSWMNQTMRENITEDGTIAVLVFEIAEDAEVGDYDINLSYDFENYDIVNSDMEAVYFHTVDATITVLDLMYGDVNRDGRVNLLDSTILARYVAKWPDYTASSLDLQAADVNNDGRVNLLDSTILARHVAKWPDYSELPYSS